jgi:predicted thioredoxin/glutaredoxin
VGYKELKKINDRDVVKRIVIKNGEELTEEYKEKLRKTLPKVVIKHVE